MELSDITRSLQEIPRTIENIPTIRELISKIGKKAYMLKTLHCGYPFPIIRARVNDENNPIFTEDRELSYKPSDRNTTYQRASTPNQTMFYGCYNPEDDNPDFPPARTVAMLESSNWLRQGDKTSIGRQKITFGKWIIMEDLHLIPVFLPPNVLETSYNLNLNKEYNKCLAEANLSSHLIQESIELMHFLGQEFRRKINNQYDYSVSALFTEYVVRHPYIDGVVYPSVRGEFLGCNVAIKPSAMHKLQLRAVGENMIYKKGDQLRVQSGYINYYAQDTKHMATFKIQPEEEKPEEIEKICSDFKLASIDELPLIP